MQAFELPVARRPTGCVFAQFWGVNAGEEDPILAFFWLFETRRRVVKPP